MSGRPGRRKKAGFPFPAAISNTWTVVYFEPLDAKHTKITIRMLGYEQDGESQKMRAFFERGNKATLESFLKKFEGTSAGTVLK